MVRYTVATIAKNPAEFIRLPDGSRLFQAEDVSPDFRGGRGILLVIDDDFVNPFGMLKCPANVWSASSASVSMKCGYQATFQRWPVDFRQVLTRLFRNGLTRLRAQ